MEVIRIQLWQPRIQSWQLTIISFEATSFLGGVKIDHQRSPGRNLMPFELLEASWKVLGSVLDYSRSPRGPNQRTPEWLLSVQDGPQDHFQRS